MTKLKSIEIDFPVEVEISHLGEALIKEVIDDICRSYERKNPHRVMWVSSFGQKPLMAWGQVDENHPMKFDASTWYIEIDEREDFNVTDKASLQGVLGALHQTQTSEDIQELIQKAYALGLKDREIPLRKRDPYPTRPLLHLLRDSVREYAAIAAAPQNLQYFDEARKWVESMLEHYPPKKGEV